MNGPSYRPDKQPEEPRRQALSKQSPFLKDCSSCRYG